MRAGGGGVIAALAGAPRVGAHGLIALLPHLLRLQRERSAYSAYAAECLRILTENTAKLCSGEFINVKLEDVINPKPVDDRPVEEITADIIQRCGLEVRKN